MELYEFRLILNQLDFSEEEADDLYGRCKDGTLITADGRTFLDVERRADSLDEAMRTAIADVNAAGFRVARIEIEADSLALQQA